MSASESPATVPGTPTPSPVSRDFLGSAWPSGPRKMSERAAAGRRLAIVDGDVLVAVGEMHHHEAAAADVAGLGQGHREREADRDGRVDRVAAAREHVEADLGRPPLLAHHHAVRRGRDLRRGDAGALQDEAVLRRERCRGEE